MFTVYLKIEHCEERIYSERERERERERKEI